MLNSTVWLAKGHFAGPTAMVNITKFNSAPLAEGNNTSRIAVSLVLGRTGACRESSHLCLCLDNFCEVLLTAAVFTKVFTNEHQAVLMALCTFFLRLQLWP